MFSPNLVSHPQRHVTFFQAPRNWLESARGAWAVREPGAPLLAADVALRSRVKKYIARSDVHVLMRFEVIFQDSRQHSRADRL